MNTYKVKSGELDAVYECPFTAEATHILAVVLERDRTPNLGRIAEISGGQYDLDPVYVSVERALKSIGRMA